MRGHRNINNQKNKRCENGKSATQIKVCFYFVILLFLLIRLGTQENEEEEAKGSFQKWKVGGEGVDKTKETEGKQAFGHLCNGSGRGGGQLQKATFCCENCQKKAVRRNLL